MKMLSTFALLLLLTSSLQAATGDKIIATKSEGETLSNPSVVNISTAKASQHISLVLRSTEGKILMTQELIASESAIKVKLPTLPAGLYLLSAKGSTKAQTQKFTIR
ncbi:MAG: T9SS type A sorting domain-containing protein [Bacteroidota bacterium]